MNNYLNLLKKVSSSVWRHPFLCESPNTVPENAVKWGVSRWRCINATRHRRAYTHTLSSARYRHLCLLSLTQCGVQDWTRDGTAESGSSSLPRLSQSPRRPKVFWGVSVRLLCQEGSFWSRTASKFVLEWKPWIGPKMANHWLTSSYSPSPLVAKARWWGGSLRCRLMCERSPRCTIIHHSLL